MGPSSQQLRFGVSFVLMYYPVSLFTHSLSGASTDRDAQQLVFIKDAWTRLIQKMSDTCASHAVGPGSGPRYTGVVTGGDYTDIGMRTTCAKMVCARGANNLLHACELVITMMLLFCC